MDSVLWSFPLIDLSGHRHNWIRAGAEGSDLRHQASDEPLTRTYWRRPADTMLQKSASLEPTPDPQGMLMM